MYTATQMNTCIFCLNVGFVSAPLSLQRCRKLTPSIPAGVQTELVARGYVGSSPFLLLLHIAITTQLPFIIEHRSANERCLATLESGIESFRQWHRSANEIESESS